jgi:uncharacterized protein YdhG (YjbR/CyaY superfamily)
MPTKPATTIDAYLATVADDKRAALEKLRALIRSAAPAAEECISYGLAAFRLGGRPLVAFGAAGGHCAFYPMSASTVADHRDALAGYDTSKGTIRFTPARPLPAALVRKLVKARVAENRARDASPHSRKTHAPARAKDGAGPCRPDRTAGPSRLRDRRSDSGLRPDRTGTVRLRPPRE